MKTTLLFTLIFLLFCTDMQAQTIETPANTSLTITSDINLLQGKSIQIEDGPLLKLLPASSGNVMLGIGTGQVNTTGRFNTYLGYQAGTSAVADSNTFVGYLAGFSTTTGRSNTFYGANAGKGNASGSRNTFIGRNTGAISSNGDDNVYLGYNAGLNDRGSKNTFLGQGAGVLAGNGTGLHNATAVGADAYVSASNSIVLGNQANVGVGTSAPQTKLEVVSDQPDESGLRLSQLTSASRKERVASRFLTVNEKGDVELARYRLQINSPKEWADYVFSSGYQLRPLADVSQYINRHQHLPGIPSANEIVEKGIDIAELNVKLLQKLEELTLYIIDLQTQLNQQKRQLSEIQRLPSN